MITEVRHLIFQDVDVQRALVAFRKNRGEPLPAGNIVCVKVEKAKAGIRCVLDVDSDTDGHRKSYLFTADEILPALISYCIGKNVPLPAKSPKFLKIFGDQIGFIVPVNLSDSGLRRLQEQPA